MDHKTEEFIKLFRLDEIDEKDYAKAASFNEAKQEYMDHFGVDDIMTECIYISGDEVIQMLKWCVTNNITWTERFGITDNTDILY
jgi:hypothetical protein